MLHLGRSLQRGEFAHHLLGQPAMGTGSTAFAAYPSGSIHETGARMAAEAPRPRVYFEDWDEPLISGIS